MPRYLELLAKAGAIVSAAGVVLLGIFIFVLLVFPVTKSCETGKCTYASSAPTQLQPVFSQGFFASSLIVIASGIVMIRFSRWRETTSSTQN
jgi:hypothetical protein